MPDPKGTCTEKFVCFCLGSVELQLRENGIFFTPVKYTLACHAPPVSWAARHSESAWSPTCQKILAALYKWISIKYFVLWKLSLVFSSHSLSIQSAAKTGSTI